MDTLAYFSSCKLYYGCAMKKHEPDFWLTKSLTELTPAEWDALCDGCGRCCMNKLEDEDTGEILYRCRLQAPQPQYLPLQGL